MTNRNCKTILALVMVPMLVATASLAQETPTAPADPAPTGQPTSDEQKARDAEMARLNHQKAVAEARQAIEEAQKARREAAGASVLGPLSAHDGAEGKATIDEGHRSELEATLLSSIALREAAGPLGVQLAAVARRLDPAPCGEEAAASGRPATPCPQAEAPATNIADLRSDQLCPEVRGMSSASPTQPRPIVFVPEDSRGPVSLAETFEVRSAALASEFCRAIDEAAEATRRNATLEAEVRGTGERAGGSVPVAAIAGVVDTVANMLRTDYTVYGIALEEDQNLFVREMARAFLATGRPNPVYTPGLFPLGQSTADNPALRRIALLDRLRAAAAAAAASQGQQSRQFEQRLASAGNRTAEVRAAKDAHDGAKKRLEAAIKAYDDLMRSLTSQEGTDPPALAGILRQAYTAELLRRGGLLVVTNVHFMGGTSYTRQNFFSGLFGMPYRVSGGVLVSYIVQDGQSGQVYDARSVPVSGGFYRPTEIRAAIAQGRR
jgi:hypothetical protein